MQFDINIFLFPANYVQETTIFFDLDKNRLKYLDCKLSN